MVNIPDKWQQRLLKKAFGMAEWSKDPSTQVGAIATRGRRTVTEGFNGFPEGTSDDQALYENRDVKYRRTVHAEANLICQAAKYGIALYEADVYSTFHPCSKCAGLLINVGIANVYYDDSQPIPERWQEDMDEAAKMLREAGIPLIPLTFSAF